MTDDDYDRCMRVLTARTARHNLHTTKAGIIRTPWYVEARLWGELSTFDTDELTLMVLAAHRERVRLSIRGRSAPSSAGLLEVRLHPRAPFGALHERHPGLDRLADVSHGVIH